MSNEYLAHYGVMGMKWGVRKDGMPRGYQGGKGRSRSSKAKSSGASRVKKATGALRSGASRIKQASADRKAKDTARKKQAAFDAIDRGDAKALKKNINALSDSELNSAMDRVKKRQTLLNQVSGKTTSDGQNATMNALKKGANEGLKSLAETAVKGLGSDATGTAARAAGAGVAQVMTYVAMNGMSKGAGTGKIDFNAGEVFRDAAKASLEKSMKERMNTGKDKAKNEDKKDDK